MTLTEILWAQRQTCLGANTYIYAHDVGQWKEFTGSSCAMQG